MSGLFKSMRNTHKLYVLLAIVSVFGTGCLTFSEDVNDYRLTYVRTLNYDQVTVTFLNDDTILAIEESTPDSYFENNVITINNRRIFNSSEFISKMPVQAYSLGRQVGFDRNGPIYQVNVIDHNVDCGRNYNNDFVCIVNFPRGTFPVAFQYQAAFKLRAEGVIDGGDVDNFHWVAESPFFRLGSVQRAR